jgi:hypothetical protein
VPRSNRPKRSKKADEAELDLAALASRSGFRRTEFKRGVEYTVQSTIGANAEDGKTWVCPHCQLQIAKGISHLVAFDAVRGVETRRHFHSACWSAYQGVLI